MLALKRFVTIVFAYAVTVFVAALGASLAIEMTSLSPSESLAIFAIFGFACLIIGMFAAIPSAVLVLIAEFLKIRSPFYYVTIAVVAGVIFARVLINQTWMLFVGAGLGVVCGAIYWMIAGRKAGILKHSENGTAHRQLMLLLAAVIAAEAVLFLVFMR